MADEKQLGGLRNMDMLVQAAVFVAAPKAMFAIGADVVGIVQGRVPVGATGRYKRSIQQKTEGAGFDSRVLVFSDVDYDEFVEDGRGPTVKKGPVPLSELLEQWARQRGLNPFAVAKSIHKRGTLRFRTGRDSRGRAGAWKTTKAQLSTTILPPHLDDMAKDIAETLASAIEEAA